MYIMMKKSNTNNGMNTTSQVGESNFSLVINIAKNAVWSNTVNNNRTTWCTIRNPLDAIFFLISQYHNRQLHTLLDDHVIPSDKELNKYTLSINNYFCCCFLISFLAKYRFLPSSNIILSFSVTSFNVGIF